MTTCPHCLSPLKPGETCQGCGYKAPERSKDWRFRQNSDRRTMKNPARPSRELLEFVSSLELSRKEPNLDYVEQLQLTPRQQQKLDDFGLWVIDWNDLWRYPDPRRMLKEFDTGEDVPQIFIMHTTEDQFVLVDTSGYRYPRYMGILPRPERYHFHRDERRNPRRRL